MFFQKKKDVPENKPAPQARPVPGQMVSAIELDALKEVANIGSGNASIALSSIFNKRVNISTPIVQIVQLDNIPKDFKNENGIVVGVYSRLLEGMEGNVVIFFPTSAALKFVSVLKGHELGNKEVLNKDEEDLLRKVSSVIYTAYISGLATFFEQKIIFSDPDLISSYSNTFLDSILSRLDQKENILIININFVIEDTEINGDFTLVLTMNSLAPLLTKINKKMTG
jgi:chemotaxis protein CheC